MPEDIKIFICACCDQKFVDNIDREKELQEKEMNFPNMPLEEMVRVCTVCFIKIMDAEGRENYILE